MSDSFIDLPEKMREEVVVDIMESITLPLLRKKLESHRNLFHEENDMETLKKMFMKKVFTEFDKIEIGKVVEEEPEEPLPVVVEKTEEELTEESYLEKICKEMDEETKGQLEKVEVEKPVLSKSSSEIVAEFQLGDADYTKFKVYKNGKFENYYYRKGTGTLYVGVISSEGIMELICKLVQLKMNEKIGSFIEKIPGRKKLW